MNPAISASLGIGSRHASICNLNTLKLSSQANDGGGVDQAVLATVGMNFVKLDVANYMVTDDTWVDRYYGHRHDSEADKLDAYYE